MTTKVSAVVLAHDESESLNRVLDQLAKQTIAPARILVVDTSKKQAASAPGLEVLTLNPKTNFATAIEAAVRHLSEDGYLWILHDDSAPEPDALEKLLREIELSPSIAIVGPKQVDWDNPKLIKQLGITLTKSGRLFSRVRGEFDQGQHDRSEDVMAVGTAGALMSLAVYKDLGGFDSKAPQLASDIDFCIRARLQGHRIQVAPAAKISHRMLSLNSGRSGGWLGGSASKAIAEAEFHLGLSYANFLVFFMGWLFLLPFSVLSSLVLLVRKKTSRIPGELAGALAAFFGIGRILSSRSKIKKTTKLKISTLNGLRASRQELKKSNQREKDNEVSLQLLDAHARGDNEQQSGIKNTGIISSRAIWFALVLAGLSFSWFPTNVALTGSGVIPLSSNWLDIFFAAGSSSGELGLGFIGAGDPFIWTLALLSAPFFFEPSLAISVLVYLSLPIAFLGVFKLAGLVSWSNPVRITAGLAYALWPAVIQNVLDVNFPQLLAILVLPWLLLSIAKVARVGNLLQASVFSSWSQVGIAAILLAVVASASPVLGLVLMGLIVLLGVIRPTKLIALVFTTGLTFLWFTPLALERIASGNLLALFLEPGSVSETNLVADWTLAFYGFSFQSLDWALFITAPVLIVALVAVLRPSLKTTLLLWTLGALVLAAAWVIVGVEFSFEVGSSQSMDASTVLALFAIIVLLLFAHAADASSAMRIASVLIVALIGVVPAVFGLLTTPGTASFSDGRSVPSIVQADADAGLQIKTLKLAAYEDGSISAELFSGAGIKLDQLSSGFRIANSSDLTKDANHQELGQLVANLISANGAEIFSTLEEFGIGYVLVSPSDRDFQMALDSTGELESIGETDFGQLWKVRGVIPANKKLDVDFSLSKIVSLAGFGFYLLLSLPSRASRSRSKKESKIFVDLEENN
jgi:GT2 family glycosyltransferase